MATYHRQNPHVGSNSSTISYVIRNKEERCHRSGVNSLQYDYYLERLYSSGRDSVIRAWNLGEKSPRQLSQRWDYNSSTDAAGGSQIKKASNENDCYIKSLEHHTDWVNDISLCCEGRNLISVSNDATIKVWNAHKGFCLSTLRSHKDYAKCLAYAKDREVIASAGFDRMIYLWDVQSLTMLSTTKNTVTTKPLDGSKSSIYSLAITHNGNMIASGSTEKVIRLWDPRSRQKLVKLRGHTDNVKSLLFSNDGSLLLSASSDNTVRLWSVGQQRCISIIRAHDEGVWSVQADETFDTVYSGGKDRKLFMTNLKQTSQTALVCEEKEPILKLLLVNRCYQNNQAVDNGRQSLWVATSESSIRNWPIRDFDQCHHQTEADSQLGRVINTSSGVDQNQIKPDVLIKGNPAVINFYVLWDKRHIITLESDNSIGLYDVLTVRKVETLHTPSDYHDSRVRFEAEIKRRSSKIFVPSWFTVDHKIGYLSIHLEESESLNTWVSARDYGLAPNLDPNIDPKVNLGRLIILALFEYWPPTYERIDGESKCASRDGPSSIEEHEQQSLDYSKPNQSSNRLRANDTNRVQSNGICQRIGNQYFSIPSHTPIIVHDGNQSMTKFLVHETGKEGDDTFVHEYVPHWVLDIVLGRVQPRFIKISFFLQAHPNSCIKSLRKERLTATDMIIMRKISEHVYEKILPMIMDERGVSHYDQGSAKGSNNSADSNVLPFRSVDLYCNEQKIDEELDLRTIKHLLWKSTSDLLIHYFPMR